MYAVPPPKAVSAPRTPAEVRKAAAVLWNGGTRYRVTNPTSGRSVRLDVASDGGVTRLRLQTPMLVIWLGGSSKNPTPTFVCVQVPPGGRRATRPPQRRRPPRRRSSCDPPAAPVRAADRPGRSDGRARAGHDRGGLSGRLPAGEVEVRARSVRLCTTRDGLLTEVDYKGARIQAISVKTAVTSSDLAPSGLNARPRLPRSSQPLIQHSRSGNPSSQGLNTRAVR